MKRCTFRDCLAQATWRIVGKPIVTCDEHLQNARERWPAAVPERLAESAQTNGED